jgi:hypothetical protein
VDESYTGRHLFIKQVSKMQCRYIEVYHQKNTIKSQIYEILR